MEAVFVRFALLCYLEFKFALAAIKLSIVVFISIEYRGAGGSTPCVGFTPPPRPTPQWEPL
jgi:hypothetical protein